MERREHKVTGKCSLNRNLSRLEVSNLTDKNDVRILTKEGPQGGAEVQTDVVVHLHLIDAEEVVLHGILGGGDVGI